MKNILLTFFGLFLVAGVSLANTSEFTISVMGGEDNEPPTTPTLLSAVPVASSQIDILWSAATDNYLVSGYVLLRDSIPIATTTLTNFIDTGLSAETLYTYEVYAFDAFYNISTTSNAVATTTLALPIVPPTPTSTVTTVPSSATQLLLLKDLRITPAFNSALFTWETNIPSHFTLRWGRSDLYNAGYIMNDVYLKAHQTLITDLEPGTVYLYELIGYTPSGQPFVLGKGEFRTLMQENLIPVNVQNLNIKVDDKDVILTWVMPSEVGEARVRIVRSHLGYPTDPYDGAVIFDGRATAYFDKEALSLYEEQFYTVFVLMPDGSVSSGAVGKARRGGAAASSPFQEDLIDLEDFDFRVEQISIKQGASSFNFKSEYIELYSTQPFLISIPYEALPKHLKSLVITLLDPTDSNRSYSFLLRINKDRTAYEATVAALEVVGQSLIELEFFDYERKIIGRYRKAVSFVAGPSEYKEVIFPDLIVKTIEPFFPVITAALLVPLFWMFVVYRRSRATEDNL